MRTNKIILGLFVGMLLISCATDVDSPDFGQKLRSGEPEGYTTYTGRQTVQMYDLQDGFYIQGVIVTNFEDPMDDDDGDGTYNYPTAPDWASGDFGFLDIHDVLISTNETHVFFYIAFQNLPYSGLCGFNLNMVSIWLADNLATTGTNELRCYSPGDSRPTNYFKADIAGSERPWDYSIHLEGSGGDMIDSEFSEIAAVEILGPEDEITSQDLVCISNAPSIPIISIAVKGSLLGSGSWRVFVTAHNWEDYGLNSAVPGVNGHTRDVLTSAGNMWDFTTTGNAGNAAHIMDMAGSPLMDQYAILDTSSAVVLSNMYVRFILTNM